MGPSVPDAVRDLFVDMHGKTLSELSGDGKLRKINKFIQDNQDKVFQYDPHGLVPLAGVPKPLDHFGEDTWPITPLGLYDLALGDQVWYHTQLYEI